MHDKNTWLFIKAVSDGEPLLIEGLDVWKYDWIDTRQTVRIKDPQYHRSFMFNVYEIRSGDRIVHFAAGEFSNGVWGFFVRQRE